MRLSAVPLFGLLGLLGGAVACAAEEGSDGGGEIAVGVNIELSGSATG